MGKAGILIAALLATGCASTQAGPKSAAAPDAGEDDGLMAQAQVAARRAGEIAVQPARDVGIAKAEIPPALTLAVANPYSLKGLKRCPDLRTAIGALNAVLGPDFSGTVLRNESRVGKLAEAGGKTVVNSILPFRGLVREVSGAAPAERRKNAAIDAGYARRGYLRGVYETRRCKPALDAG